MDPMKIFGESNYSYFERNYFLRFRNFLKYLDTFLENYLREKGLKGGFKEVNMGSTDGNRVSRGLTCRMHVGPRRLFSHHI